MTIEFSREQFENLLKLAHLGQWMVNGIRAEEEHVKKFHDVGQLLFANAHQEEFGSFVALDESQKAFIPGASLEEDEELNDLKEYYNEELFWTELVERLASRDFVDAYSDTLQNMSEADQIRKKSEFLAMYVSEFEKNGIERLRMNKS